MTHKKGLRVLKALTLLPLWFLLESAACVGPDVSSEAWRGQAPAVTAFSCVFAPLRSACSARLLLPLRPPRCKPHRSLEEGFRKAFRPPAPPLL